MKRIISTIAALTLTAAPVAASPTWEDQAFIICLELADVVIEEERAGKLSREQANQIITRCLDAR